MSAACFTNIATVRNETNAIRAFVDALLERCRKSDESLIVDGLSTDGARDIIEDCAARSLLRDIPQPCNIAQRRGISSRQRVFNILICVFPQFLRALARMIWEHLTQPRDEALNREIVVFHFPGLMQGLYRSR